MDSRICTFWILLMDVDRLFSIKAMPNPPITNNVWQCLFYHVITEKLDAIDVFKCFVSWIGWKFVSYY